MRLLTAKYIPESNILQSTIPKGSSYSWQSINRAATLLKPGYTVQVGQGDVSLWYERWLHNGRLCDRVPYVELHDMHLKIQDIHHDGLCHFEQLRTPIPLDTQLEIQSVFINHHSQDSLIWEHASNGTYSAKSSYSWLMQAMNTPLSRLLLLGLGFES